MRFCKTNLALLLSSTAAIIALPTAALAQAQTSAAPANAADEVTEGEEIVVSGYRASLESAAAAKREATNFTESISAQDIGKFPDLNLAESLQRLPGIQISRDTSSGEGTQVRVRGLGPSFTRVTLNGTPITPATDGGIRGNTNGREVDLNLLPSELFNKLEVSKSAEADQLEGGVSSVNLRPASAFDKPGQHFYVAANSNYSSTAKKFGYGGTLIYSNTWDDFGVLIGAVGSKRYFDNTTYWSSNWTNANLNCPGCDNTQSNNFTFATTVPANSGNGLVAGTPLDLAALLALNPGLTGNQLTNAFIPRADRHSVLRGSTQRATGLISLDWRPGDDLEFSLSGMLNKTETNFRKSNSNWYVRSSSPAVTGGMVPIGVTVDANNVIRSGRFANSNFFSIQEDTFEDSYFWHINPTLTWRPGDNAEIKLNTYYSEAQMKRLDPQLWVTTLLNRGITATYAYPEGQSNPTVSFDVDLANPNSGLWTWENNSMRDEKRDTSSKGAILDFGYNVTPDFKVSVGGAYDETNRSIDGRVIGVNAQLFAQIPQAQIANYLQTVSSQGVPNAGYNAFVAVDVDRVLANTNLLQLLNAAPQSTRTAQGANTGDVQEKVKSAYLQFAGKADLLGRDLRVNGGIRYVHTDQLTSGLINLGGVFSTLDRKSNYDAWLPSLNVSYEPADNVILRAAASRTMTRANPQQILPGTVISDATVQNANSGNPNLTPFFSSNYDVGLEYYIGRSGYIAVNGFMKRVTGFPTVVSRVVPFGDLGIPIASLLPFQQTAVNAAGGLAAPVNVSQPVNTEVVKLKGFEAAWVQPLDFLIKGTGFNASFTYVSDGDTNVPTAISPRIYNLVAYYENDAFEARVSWVKQSERLLAGAPTNGFRNFVTKEAGRSQVDVTAAYTFKLGGRDLRVSVDGINIFNKRIDSFITDGTVKLPIELNNAGSQYRLEISMNF